MLKNQENLIKKQFALFLFSFIFANNLFASGTMTVQVNPVPFFQKGYDLSVGLLHYKFKYQVEVHKSNEAHYISQKNPYDVDTKFVGVLASYFVQSDDKGMGTGTYFGLGGHRVQWMFKHPNGQKSGREVDFLGPHAGYLWEFGTGRLFLNFLLAYEYNISHQYIVNINGDRHEIPEASFVPSIAFGIGF